MIKVKKSGNRNGLERYYSKVPYTFVVDLLLDSLNADDLEIRPMFGCYAIYRNQVLNLILRDRATHVGDNGIWIATTYEHHVSLQSEFPSLKSVELLGRKASQGGSQWRCLPAAADDFEEVATKLCELIISKDVRIGKVKPSKKRPLRKKGPVKKVSNRKNRNAK